MIVMTGRSGSLGSVFPESVVALKTRLEADGTKMLSELKSLRTTPDIFIHSAGLVPVQKCSESPKTAHELNVGGSEKWFRAAAQFGMSRFVYISTSHVFEPTAEAMRLKPSAQTSPVSVYGQSKLAGEKRLLELADEFPGTQLLILRVFSLLSSTMRPGFLNTDLHRRARDRDLKPIPGLRNLRDFITAEDASARILKIAMAREATEEIYHVCTGQAHSVGELATAIFRKAGVDSSLVTEDSATIHKPRNCLLGEPTLLPEETSIEFTSIFGEREQYKGQSGSQV
jgi:nucleoside-diphosphate-sugar epimerase